MQTIPRRQALHQLGLIAAGLAAACTPVRVLVSAYPQAFDDDDELVDRVLRAFVTADEFSRRLRGAGYGQVESRPFILGGIALHWAK